VFKFEPPLPIISKMFQSTYLTTTMSYFFLSCFFSLFGLLFLKQL